MKCILAVARLFCLALFESCLLCLTNIISGPIAQAGRWNIPNQSRPNQFTNLNGTRTLNWIHLTVTLILNFDKGGHTRVSVSRSQPLLEEEDDEEVGGDGEGDDGDVQRRPVPRYEQELKGRL